MLFHACSLYEFTRITVRRHTDPAGRTAIKVFTWSNTFCEKCQRADFFMVVAEHQKLHNYSAYSSSYSAPRMCSSSSSASSWATAIHLWEHRRLCRRESSVIMHCQWLCWSATTQNRSPHDITLIERRTEFPLQMMFFNGGGRVDLYI